MATLHVRGVPDDLYAQLQMIAETHQRSLSFSGHCPVEPVYLG